MLKAHIPRKAYTHHRILAADSKRLFKDGALVGQFDRLGLIENQREIIIHKLGQRRGAPGTYNVNSYNRAQQLYCTLKLLR